VDQQGPPTEPLPPPPVSPTAPTEPLPRDAVTQSAPRGPNLDPKKTLFVVGALVLLGVIAFAAIQLSKDDAEPDKGNEVAALDGNAQLEAAAKARFIERANHICDRAAARQERMIFPDTQADLVRYASRNLKLIEGVVRDLKNLKEPKTDRRILTKMFAVADKQLTVARRLPDLAASGDSIAIEALTKKIDQLGHKIDALALSYGLVDCGVGWSR
jgi:hypothetical protein